MSRMFLFLIAATAFSLLLIYAVSYSIRLRNHGKYDKTVSVLTVWADRYEQGCALQIPATDAWGRSLSVTTNNEQIVVVSQGADASSNTDDIVLTINRECGSCSICYSYASKHYSSGVFY